MAAVLPEEEQVPVMGEKELEPARSEEAAAEAPYAEVTGETGSPIAFT